MKKKNTHISLTNTQSISPLWGIIIFLLFLLLGGLLSNTIFVHKVSNFTDSFRRHGRSFVSVDSLSKGDYQVKAGENQEFIVYDGRTYLPASASAPLELVILNDKSCGIACSSQRIIAHLKTVLTPALLVREVDINSVEGEKLQGLFEPIGVPAYILGGGTERFEENGQPFVEKFKDVLVEKGDYYLFDPERSGFPIGEFLVDQAIPLEGEPSLGSGGTKIIAYLDLQDKASAAFYRQNKDLLRSLVAEGKVRFVVKDLMEWQHREAENMHLAAHCIRQAQGTDGYFSFIEKVFATQDEWGGKHGEERDFISYLVKELEGDADSVLACVDRGADVPEIREDMQEGKALGFEAAPAIIVGNKIFRSAIGPEMLQDELN